MKRILKIMLVVLVMGVVSVLSIGCGQDSDSTAVTEEQLVAVQRGDLTIDITAVGNLAFARREELTFEAAGTVGEILVEVGDRVEEEQVLAELDDTSIIWLQEAVAQARINLENAEENLEEVENPYTELDIAQAEAAVVNAGVALEAAREALEEAESPFTESDIVQAELAVINAEIALDMAQKNFEKAEAQYRKNRSYQKWKWDYEQKQKELAIAEFNLAEAEETLAEMKIGADPLEVEQKQKQLTVVQVSLEEADDTLAEIEAWIEGAVDIGEVELKQLEVASAQAALDEAIERLEMTTMIAPFAGIVTSVNVEAGEAVNANQVVIELVDPNKFEAEILVGETDILNVRPGAEASIRVDSISGISLPAQVTFISPTATIQQGIVSYKVKVEIQSLQAMMLEWPEARQEARPDISSGELPERIRQAIEAGLITQEQAEEMLGQIEEGGMPFSARSRQSGMHLFPEGGQLPMMTTGDFQFREGLTVTVSIILAERNNVLLVPNAAIIRQGLETYVQVLEEGVIEVRSIITGISDWQYTEIIDGLSEGEEVVVPQGTTTTPTTPQPRGGFPFFGGGGRGGGEEH